jgi:Fic family protein
MNCYYSNLIEGHNTHPRDIEKALAENFSKDKEKRNLQLEAKAHISVQRMIDEGNFWEIENIVSKEFIAKIHEEFYKLLPEELCQVQNPDTGKIVTIEPGKFRDGDVSVGRHIPPLGINLDLFLNRFEEAYSPKKLSRLREIIAVAASHHRLAWIHPFYDGNGRVTRLFSHSFLKYIGIGSGLWSISRGLARQSSEYKALLQAADNPRQGDLDGRGSLSHAGLVKFCKFFLEVCIDQIDYMSSILEPQELLRRIELYTEDEIRAGRLPKGSFQLLREAVLQGEFERGKATEITAYKSRQATTVVSKLCAQGLLVSDTPKGPVRLGFPVAVLERWLPSLYPG